MRSIHGNHLAQLAKCLMCLEREKVALRCVCPQLQTTGQQAQRPGADMQRPPKPPKLFPLQRANK